MGPNILGVRFFHCLVSATTCVLIYQLAKRHFGEGVGRMSAIFCMLMPNLVYYCGIHLKEADMVFLTVLFVDSIDRMIVSSKFNTKCFILALLSFLAVFAFRTVLGAIELIATFVALVFNKGPLNNWWKRITIIVVVAIAMSVTMIGNRIMGEFEEVWKGRVMNQRAGMEWRAERESGNSFARYASKTVFAPLIFTLPFPTMVNTPGQENQQMLHGGNYVKNIMSGFVIFALVMLLLNGDWRKHTMPLAIMIGYLMVIAFSNFAHSERFHQPALPFELMFAAVGISMLKKKHVKWIDYWMYGIVVANIAWAWFKLAGRGMV
jgi:4-amino-4-deoxy-L-arabinose transferase-like glycosyltransferase